MLIGCCLFFCKPYGTGHENYNKKFAHSLTHLLVQLLHAHQVDGLEPVACRADEVEADVDPAVVVHGEVPLNLQLLLQVGLRIRIRIRIGSGFNRVSRSGSTRAKMTYQSRKIFLKFMF
jgi:hypothetical protein